MEEVALGDLYLSCIGVWLCSIAMLRCHCDLIIVLSVILPSRQVYFLPAHSSTHSLKRLLFSLSFSLSSLFLKNMVLSCRFRKSCRKPDMEECPQSKVSRPVLQARPLLPLPPWRWVPIYIYVCVCVWVCACIM